MKYITAFLQCNIYIILYIYIYEWSVHADFHTYVWKIWNIYEIYQIYIACIYIWNIWFPLCWWCKHMYVRLYTRSERCMDCIWLYTRVCTLYIHCIDLAVQLMYLSVHVSSCFIPRTWKTILCYKYCLEVCHYVLACTALVIGMYYAIVQESDILCIQGSDRDIPLKNGLGRVVAFL